MRSKPLAVCAALVTALSANAAFAGITIDNVLRIVFIDNIAAGSQDSGPDTGIFIDAASNTSGAGDTLLDGQATQNTLIGPLTFSGSGSATLHANLPAVGGPHTESLFRVTFTITTAHTWVTNGTVSQTADGGTGQSIARLAHSSGPDVILANADGNLNATNVDFIGSGILTPGTYYFETFAFTDQGGGGDDPPHTANVFASFDNVSLTLTDPASAVPEPASLSLLTLGAGGLLLRRRAR